MIKMDATFSIIELSIIFSLFNLCYGQLAFVAQPHDMIVPPNLPLQIPCVASNSFSGTLHILWKRNDTWIVDFNSKHYRQLANGSLLFESFLYADQGIYQCSALVIDSSNNHLGQIYSQNGTIKIAYIQDTFIVHPEIRSGLIGSTIQLQCLSPKSEPMPKVDWEKDNVKLTGYLNGSLPLLSEKRVSSTLMIQNLSNGDAGSYRCVAYNPLLPGKMVRSNIGAVTIAARQEQPYFEKRPATAVASRSQPFTWDCHISGIPEPTVQWLHNGQPIVSDQNRIQLASGSLHFVSVLEIYNGSYVCTGSNTLGRISSQPVAFIVAFIDYDFATDPTSSTVLYGDTLLLRCVPPRRYPLATTITWYKDYAVVTLGGSVSVTADYSLSITGVTRSSEGVYFCEAYNTVTRESRTSKSATITVRVLPNVLIDTTNTSAIIGASVTKICTASGHPTPSIEWIKGSTLISSDGTLNLSAVNLSDSGFYTCVATNVAGNDSKRFFLHVSSKPIVYLAPSNETRIVNQSVQFSCDFSGTPKPTTSWYFIEKGSSLRQHLTFDSRIARTASGIHIAPVRKSDEGRYICEGSSSGGSLEVSAFLTVFVPPSFQTRPRNQTTAVSFSFTLQCSASGDPTPSITWVFDSNILSNGGKYLITSESLTVRNVATNDKGWYICRINNSAGTETSNAFVDVQDAPTMTKFLVPEKVRVGDSFTISCEGIGNPQPSIKWRRNSTLDLQMDGSRVAGNLTHIIINQARSSDSGTYECILTNAVNTVVRSGSLTVQVLPYPPRDLTINAVRSTALVISWAPGFDGFSAILSYSLELQRQGAPQWRTIDGNITAQSLNYTITGLQPFTLYELRMRTYTMIGKSGYSNIVKARTLEDAPSAPVNIEVFNITATYAIVRWNPPEHPNGNITMYQVTYGIFGSSAAKQTTIKVDNDLSYNVLMRNLMPFTRYSLQIRAATNSSFIPNWGNYSNQQYFKTSEAVPSGSPLHLNATSTSSTSVTLTFSAMSQSLLNGIFTGYLVTIELEASQTTVESNDTRVVVSSLRKATRYSFYVKVCNRVGCGPDSKAVRISTLENVPGVVSNATAVAISPTSILIEWSEPSEKNGKITGYVVIIRNGSRNFTEYLQSSRLQFQKDGLQPNRTYFVTIAARTRIGIGPKLPEIQVQLTNAPSPISSTKPSTITTESTTPPSSTNAPIGVEKQQSDWLHTKNLPFVIGIPIASVLIVTLIVMIVFLCRRRLRAANVNKDHWKRTRTDSGGDNPAYIPDKGVEMEKRNGSPPDQVEIPEIAVADEKAYQDDFIFENDSEFSQSVDDVNPSNQYAYDNTIPYQAKNDTSPLVKLRNVEVELSDDASEYDQPYSKIDEVFDPIPDMFAFIDEEDRKSVKTTPETQSIDDSSKKSLNDYEMNLDAGLGKDELGDPAPKTPNPSDLTWDNYDTSKAVVHDSDANPYDTPNVEGYDPTVNTPNHKRPVYKSDKEKLIDNEETII